MNFGASEEADLNTQTVQELGEFGLIDHLAKLAAGSAAVVGIGDDAAVLDLGGVDYLLATVDMMVQDVHFVLGGTDPFILGRRAFAINVSDIAAMGGEPTNVLVSLALPPHCPAVFVERLYEGLVHEAGLTRVGIVGGNVTKINGPICIDVTVLGRVPKVEVVLRSGARPGDVLAITGSLGDAAARRLARSGDRNHDPTLAALADELPASPISRVSTARGLAASRIPKAMLDLSDGLAGDIRHLCQASAVGAVIYQSELPISRQARAIARALAVSPVSLALSGGEDYELLMALSADDVVRAREVAGEVPLTVIGEVTSAEGHVTLVTDSGEHAELPPGGWTHF